jgi:hypothetical protein
MIDREKLPDLFDGNARIIGGREDEYLKFERVEKKLCGIPDLHAFMLLEQLAPGEKDLIGCAEHDIIYLDVDLDKLCENITEEQIVELRRCGIMYDDDNDCLSMFA